MVGGGKYLECYFATNISLMFYSIYYPFYFKLGEGLRSFNTILWILMTVGPAIISKSFKKTRGDRILRKSTKYRYK